MKKPNRYKIIPTEKKSIIVTRTYKTGKPSAHHEGDKFITVEETYRWGYAVIEAYKKDITKNEEIVVSEFEILDHAYDGCIAAFWEFPDDMTEEEKENIKTAYYEECDDGLEKIGWVYFDNTDKILPPFKIEKSE